MFLYWNMLLLVLKYTMFYVLSTTLLQILLYLYGTFTERFLHTLVCNNLKTLFLSAALFFFKDSNLVYCSLKDIFPLNLSSIPSNLNFFINLDQLNSSLVFWYSKMIRLSDTSSAYVLLNFKVIQLIASSIDFSFTPNTFPE